jgi:uncharacterized protein with HEPN domain
MKNNDIQRIWHIKIYCDDIMETIGRFGADYNIFVKDKDYYRSLSMCLMQISELVNDLSEDFRNNISNIIPWEYIDVMNSHMLYLFVHICDSKEKELIWQMATTYIPALSLFCENVVHYHYYNAINI